MENTKTIMYNIYVHVRVRVHVRWIAYFFHGGRQLMATAMGGRGGKKFENHWIRDCLRQQFNVELDKRITRSKWTSHMSKFFEAYIQMQTLYQ